MSRELLSFANDRCLCRALFQKRAANVSERKCMNVPCIHVCLFACLYVSMYNVHTRVYVCMYVCMYEGVIHGSICAKELYLFRALSRKRMTNDIYKCA